MIATIIILGLAVIVLCVILWSMAGNVMAQDAMIAELERGRELDADLLRLAREGEQLQRQRADLLDNAVVECHRQFGKLEESHKRIVGLAHQKALLRAVLDAPELDTPSGKIVLN